MFMLEKHNCIAYWLFKVQLLLFLVYFIMTLFLTNVNKKTHLDWRQSAYNNVQKNNCFIDVLEFIS